MKAVKKGFILFLISIILFLSVVNTTSALIIDHTAVKNFDNIPPQWIAAAKSMFNISYGHTSHGSQIVTGMQMLSSQNSSYLYTTGSSGFLCDMCITGDLGNPDRSTWATVTRAHLNGTGAKRNVIIWSWCGQVEGTESDINLYLNLMSQLEKDYPNVIFVYMTGHLTGTGPTGTVYARNNQIRNYALANNKILFDFADIESHDPDGTYYPAETDACNWCSTWCSTHTCPACGDCAHSNCFNCYNKGKAFWYMMARLAGWDGVTGKDTTAPILSNSQPSGTLSSGTTSTTISLATNEAATCKYSTTPGTAYASMTNTFSTTGSTSHATTINRLTNGQNYNYYVRCNDSSGNVNVQDYNISFNIIATASPKFQDDFESYLEYTTSLTKTEGGFSWLTGNGATLPEGTGGDGTWTRTDGKEWPVNSMIGARISFYDTKWSLVGPFIVTSNTATVLHFTGNATSAIYRGSSLPRVSTTTKYSGTKSLEFVFWPCTTAIGGSASEQRFMFSDSTETWIEYWLYVPSNYFHRMPWYNNKFMVIWWDRTPAYLPTNTNNSDDYGWHDSDLFAIELIPKSDGSGASLFRYQFGKSNGYEEVNTETVMIGSSGPVKTGAWNRIRLHLKQASAALANDGEFQVWSYNNDNGNQLVYQVINADIYPKNTTTGFGWSRGYLWGTSNSGFPNLTNIYVDDFKIYSTDPLWTNTTSVPDTFPPMVTITSPTTNQQFPAGTTSATLSVATSEAATCKYSTSNQAYDDMPNNFTTTGNTSHSTTINWLANGQSYNYYVRCSDKLGNKNSASSAISFSVNASALFCGDKVCNNNEVCSSCPADCGVCPLPTCNLTSASWSKTNAIEGESVYLNVLGTNCNGKSISFLVKEYDIVGDDNVKINPLNVTFGVNGAVGTWITEEQDDGLAGIAGNPEYYFTATVVGDTETIQSGTSNAELLSVNKKVVTTKGTVACEANITAGKKCLYVAPDGNDGDNGSINAPFKTFLPALKLVGPGDFIYARGGKYGFANAMVVDVTRNTTSNSSTSCPSGFHLTDALCFHDRYAFIGIRDFGGWATDTPGYNIQSGSVSERITITNYPGEHPILNMNDFPEITQSWYYDPTYFLIGKTAIEIRSKSYWTIQGLEIVGGCIDIAGGSATIPSPHDIIIQNNNVHDYVIEGRENPGLVRINRGDIHGPYNIFVWNNTLHDHYDVEFPGNWKNVPDGQHFGAVTTLSAQNYEGFDAGGTGYIEIINNTIYRIPQAFFFKNAMEGPIEIRNNQIQNVGSVGDAHAANIHMVNNIVENTSKGFWRVGIAGVYNDSRMNAISGNNITIENNTFVGMDNLFGISGGTNHNVHNNIFFGLTGRTTIADDWNTPAYIAKSELFADSLDPAKSILQNITSNNNCFITPYSDFQFVHRIIPPASTGTANYQYNHFNYTQASQIFGFDTNSKVIIESNVNNIFTNPTGGNYTLKAGSVAANQCAGMGAYVNTAIGATTPQQSTAICEKTGTGTCYYIDPVNGNNSNNGSFSSPFYTPQKAVMLAQPGDVIYLRGGTYNFSHAYPSGTNCWNCYPGYGKIYYDIAMIGDASSFPSEATALDSRATTYYVNSGTLANPITIKSYPGEHAILNGYGIKVREEAYWNIENLNLTNSTIFLNAYYGGTSSTKTTHDIIVRGNNIGNYFSYGGNNPGLIKIQDSSGYGPSNITIENNVLHDLGAITCINRGPPYNVANDFGNCGESWTGDVRTLLWNETRDAQHFGGITIMSCEIYSTPVGNCQGTGKVIIRNNTIYNTPISFFIKNPMLGPEYIQNNILFNSQYIGAQNGANMLFERNLVYNISSGPNIGGLPTSYPTSFFVYSGQNYTIRYNTYVGTAAIANFQTNGSGHNIYNNVIFGLPTRTQNGGWDSPSYLSRGRGADDYQNDSININTSQFKYNNNFDNNCFITPYSDFLALKRYLPSPVHHVQNWINDTYVEYSNITRIQQLLGLEINSKVIIETNPSNVFENPAANDYRLKAGSVAATQCAAMGVYAGGTTIPTTPPATPVCGDSMCNGNETSSTCLADCPASVCGDNICNGNETSSTCLADCPASVCGDNICNGNETSISCIKDCPNSFCGDKVCNATETSSTCPADCPLFCDLTSASWSKNNSAEGDVVYFEVTGNNCNLKTISFDVKEYDFLGGDDNVAINPLNIIFSGNSIKGTWVAEWQAEGTGESDPPEYYFTATVLGTGEKISSGTGSSQLLSVNKKVVTTKGTVACEANITAGKKCLYVAPDGNDGNNGSINAPFKTFLPALKLVGPGDFIYARGGIYSSANRMVYGAFPDYNTKNIGAENCPSEAVYAHYGADSTGYCTFDSYNMISIKDFGGWASKTPAYSVASGTSGNPITVKNYPGEKPIFVMDNNKIGINGIDIEDKNWWVISGFEIANGGIDIFRSHNIWIQNNDIHNRYGQEGYNNGLIYIERSDGAGIGNIYVHNNTLHDMYNFNLAGNLTGGYQQHFGAVTTMSCEGYTGLIINNRTQGNLSCGGTKYVEIANNTIYNMPQVFFFKNAMEGPILIENNYIYNSYLLGIMSSANVIMKNNLIIDTEGWQSVGAAAATNITAPIFGENATITGNTFVNFKNLLNIDRGYNHNIHNNVFFGLPTITPSSQDWNAKAYISHKEYYPDVANEQQSYLQRIHSDNNCFITPSSNFQMIKRFYNNSGMLNISHYNHTQAASVFNWDKNSFFIQETNVNNVFTNPSARNYTLKSGSIAANQCAGMGINTNIKTDTIISEIPNTKPNSTSPVGPTTTSTTPNNTTTETGKGTGGGGGGGSTGGETSIISKEKKNSGTINARKPIVFTDFAPETGITEIAIEVHNDTTDLSNIPVTVSQYETQPAEIPAAKQGKVYKYLQIDVEDSEDRISSANISFEVEKSWAEANNLDKNNIALFKFFPDESKWTQLSTVYISSDENSYYYTSQLAGFSYFVVGEAETPIKEAQTPGEVTESGSKNLKFGQGLIFLIIELILIVGIIVILIILIAKRKEYSTTKSQA